MDNAMPSERQYAVIGPLPSGTETRAFLGCEIIGGVPQRAAPVVVAWLSGEATTDPKQVSRLMREMAFLTQLDHPNVVRIIGLEYFEEGWARIAEYVEGESVERLRSGAEGRVPARVAARIIADACEGVIHAHEHGQQGFTARPVVHGAIRPDTLLVGYDGLTRVTGFGTNLISSDAPKAGAAYLAPELVIGGYPAANTGSDTYGLGAVLYLLLTGRPPFEGDDLDTRVLTGTPERPQLEGPAQELLDVALHAMAKRGSQRFPSVAALRAAIAGALANEGLASHGEVAAFLDGAVPSDAPERQQRRSLLSSIGDLDGMTTLSRPDSPPAGVDPALFEASRAATEGQRNSADTGSRRRQDDDTESGRRQSPVAAEYPPLDNSQISESTDRIQRRAREAAQPPETTSRPNSWSNARQSITVEGGSALPELPQLHGRGTIMAQSPVGQVATQGQPVPLSVRSPSDVMPQLQIRPSHPPAPAVRPSQMPGAAGGGAGSGPGFVPGSGMAPAPQQYGQFSGPQRGGAFGMPSSQMPSMAQGGVPTPPMQQSGMRASLAPNAYAMRGSMPPARGSLAPVRGSLPPVNSRNSIGSPPGRNSMPPQPVSPVPQSPIREASSVTNFRKDAGDSSRSVLYAGVGLLVLALIVIFTFPTSTPPGLSEPDTTRHKLPKELVQAALQGKGEAELPPAPEPEEVVAGPEGASGAVPAGGAAAGGSAAAGSAAPGSAGAPSEVAPAPVPGFGFLSLTSEPPVEVYNGSVLLGRTPLKAKLDSGAHKLRFTDKDKQLNLYKRYTIRAGGEQSDNLSFGTSQLIVDAPKGASISLNGKPIGRSPLEPQTIYEGRYLLKVVHEGKSWSETFDAPAGREIKYTVRMND